MLLKAAMKNDATVVLPTHTGALEFSSADLLLKLLKQLENVDRSKPLVWGTSFAKLDTLSAVRILRGK